MENDNNSKCNVMHWIQTSDGDEQSWIFLAKKVMLAKSYKCFYHSRKLLFTHHQIRKRNDTQSVEVLKNRKARISSWGKCL